MAESTDQAAMSITPTSALAGWTPEQVAQGRLWVAAWKRAGAELQRIEREELQTPGVPERMLRQLMGPADYTVPPYAPIPYSGLIEQQRWFMKAARRD